MEWQFFIQNSKIKLNHPDMAHMIGETHTRGLPKRGGEMCGTRGGGGPMDKDATDKGAWTFQPVLLRQGTQGSVLTVNTGHPLHVAIGHVALSTPAGSTSSRQNPRLPQRYLVCLFLSFHVKALKMIFTYRSNLRFFSTKL